MSGTTSSAAERPPAWRPAPLDAALSACLVGIAVLTAVVAAGRDEPGNAAPDVWWEWVVIVVPSLAVAFRSRAPELATPVAVVGQMVIWGAELAEVFVAPLVMIYSVAAEGGERGRSIGIASGAALSAMSAVGVVAAPDVDVDLVALTVLSCTAVLLLGLNAASRREEAARLAADLATARVEAEAARQRAALAERQRIARELHDLVGHSLSVIAVRAEAAERVGEDRPDVVRAAVQAMGSTARSSLVEVRSVLAGMRQDSDVAELAPAPSIAEIADLAAETAASSGLTIVHHLDGEPGSVGATVGAGAYRIVQEALTNVLKHGDGVSRVEVRVEVGTRHVRVEVTDDGAVQVSAGPSGGSGLAGMTERAEVLGGSLQAGPVLGGGFRVAAELPLVPTDPGPGR